MRLYKMAAPRAAVATPVSAASANAPLTVEPMKMPSSPDPVSAPCIYMVLYMATLVCTHYGL